jgi:hypothetical protein
MRTYHNIMVESFFTASRNVNLKNMRAVIFWAWIEYTKITPWLTSREEYVVHCLRRILLTSIPLRQHYQCLRQISLPAMSPYLLLGEKILCPVANHDVRKWLLMVIYDTVASLSITYDLGYFVEPPKALARPMRLGGFENGTNIECICIVVWTLTGKDGTEVPLLVEAYYVSTAKQRLLSPHTILCKENGMFGSYSGDEDRFELKLNDQAVISIPYDNRSSLPIAEVLVGPEPEPRVNLAGILDDSNQKLPNSSKCAQKSPICGKKICCSSQSCSS